MSSIDKSIVSILEGDIESMDYGVPELNKLFKGLDIDSKKNILKIKKKEHQVEVLKQMQDPELKVVYDKLSEKTKKELADMPFEINICF